MTEETHKLPSIPRLAFDAFQRLFADEAVPLAGNIAFRTLFSIFPFLIFLTALAGFFGNAVLAEQVVTYLLSVAPENLARPFAGEIRSILTVPRTGLLSVSALLTIWSAMGGVDSVRVGLNRAYDLRETRGILWLYLLSVIFIIGAAFVLLALALLIVFAPVLLGLADRYAPGYRSISQFVAFLRIPLAMLLLFVALVAAHKFLPARRPSFRELLPGVLTTLIVWIGLSTAFSYYLSHFSSFASTYAGLSGVFGAMFFLYLTALVVIFGGEMNRAISLQREGRSAQKPPIRGDQ
jgi:membrane protein